MLLLHFISPPQTFVYLSVTLPLHLIYAPIFIFIREITTIADSHFFRNYFAKCQQVWTTRKREKGNCRSYVRLYTLSCKIRSYSALRHIHAHSIVLPHFPHHFETQLTRTHNGKLRSSETNVTQAIRFRAFT